MENNAEDLLFLISINLRILTQLMNLIVSCNGNAVLWDDVLKIGLHIRLVTERSNMEPGNAVDFLGISLAAAIEQVSVSRTPFGRARFVGARAPAGLRSTKGDNADPPTCTGSKNERAPLRSRGPRRDRSSMTSCPPS